MKFHVTDDFRIEQVKGDKFHLDVHKLNHAEFMSAAAMCPAEEHIHDQGTAELLGFEHSRHWVSYAPGDVVYVVCTNHPVNLDGVEEYVNFKYYMISIIGGE